MKTPRAYYYMDFLEPIRSLFKLILGRHHKYEKVHQFEEEYKKVFKNENILFVSHARSALYYCLKYLDLPEGSEVMMTPINIEDMVNMIRISNLKERFVDIKIDDYSIDLDDASKKISNKTKVLFLTHLNGLVPDMDKIVSFCERNNLILIQDCTQSVGATYRGKTIESYSEISFSSLCDLKVIHTHIGGVITCRNLGAKNEIEAIVMNEADDMSIKYFSRFLLEDFIAVILLNRIIFSYLISPLLRLLSRTIGADGIENFTKGKGIKIGPIHLFKGLFGGGGNVLKREVPKGMLFRYNDLQAELGIKRLNRFRSLEDRRIHNAEVLMRELSAVEDCLAKPNCEGRSVFWKFPLRTPSIDLLQGYLSKYGIDSARSNLKCLNEIEEFNNRDATPVAHKISRETLYIPIHPYLDTNDMKEFSKCILSFFKSNSLAQE